MWPKVYIQIFLFSFFLSFLLTPLAKLIAQKRNILDKPDTTRKLHSVPKPLLGGLAIFLAFNFSVLIGLFIANIFLPYLPEEAVPYLKNIASIKGKLIGLFVGGLLVFLVGFIDDIKKFSPTQKLIGEVIAVTIAFLFGIRLTLFIPSQILNYFLTLLWIVGITNSFNLLDNMDGLSAGIAAIATFIFLIHSATLGHYFMASILCAFLGSLLGFLPYNFNPAKIFMGDAGALFIGYILGTLTVLNTYYTQGMPTRLPVLMPLLILSVPLFDTASVVIIRMKNKKPIFQGDRNHFSHRLVNLGMTTRQAVCFIYLVTFCSGVGALFLPKLSLIESLLVFSQVLSIFIIIALLEFFRRG